MKINIRHGTHEEDCLFCFMIGEELIGKSTSNFLNASSICKLENGSIIESKASGLFCFYDFRIYVDSELKYHFKRRLFGKLYDKSNNIQISDGLFFLNKKPVGTISISTPISDEPTYQITLKTDELLPVAIAYQHYFFQRTMASGYI